MNNRAAFKIDEKKLKGIAASATRKGLEAAAQSLVGSIQASLKTSKVASPPGSPPSSKSNFLRKSIMPTAVENSSVIVHTGECKYARLQEFGKQNHRSASGKFLAIPLGPAAQRIQKPTSQGGSTSLRNSPVKLVAIRSKSGKLFLFPVEKGRNSGGKWGGLAPLFKLVKSVNIHARPFMRPAAKPDGPAMRKAFGTFARAAREEIKRGVIGGVA